MEIHDLAVTRVKGAVAARIAPDLNPEGVPARFDRRLERLAVVQRADALAIDGDVKRAAP